MQGDQSCFQQVAAVLLFSCSSVWSAFPPVRWGNSVLNATLCPRDLLWDPPPALFWDVSLLLCSPSQPLSLSQSLLSASSSSMWLACQPNPALSFCWLWSITESSVLRAWFLATPLTVQQWEIGSLPLSILQGGFSVPPPTSDVSVRLWFAVYGFQFCWRVVQSAQGLH
jgi:hypothetical protein